MSVEQPEPHHDAPTDRACAIQPSAILAIRENAAGLFYERLFAIDPTTRPLFAGADMREQGAKLMSAIAMIVERSAGLTRSAAMFESSRIAIGVMESSRITTTASARPCCGRSHKGSAAPSRPS